MAFEAWVPQRYSPQPIYPQHMYIPEHRITTRVTDTIYVIKLDSAFWIILAPVSIIYTLLLLAKSFAVLDRPNLLPGQNQQSWVHHHASATSYLASYPVFKVNHISYPLFCDDDGHTRWSTKRRWQWSNPRSVMSIHDLMSAGINIIVLSLITCSRSESKYSSTKFKFVLCEKTSINYNGCIRIVVCRIRCW